MSKRGAHPELEELAGAMRGDPEALHRFCKRYEWTVERAVRFAFCMAPWDAARHSDAVQDVWTKLLRRADDGRLQLFIPFDPTKGPLGAWVWRKASSAAATTRNGLSRRWNHERVTVDGAIEDRSVGDSHDDYATRQDLRILERMLEKLLTRGERSVVHAVLVRQLTGKEAAEELGTSENAVHQALSRARRKIAKLFTLFFDGEDIGDENDEGDP